MTRLGGLALDVTAKANDEIIDRACVGVFMQIPDVLQDSFARNGFARVADEIAEKLGFHQRELAGLLADLELEGLKVESFAVEREFISGGRRG